MKYILLSLAFFTVPSIVNAQPFTTTKEVQCDKTDKMISILKGKDFEETPIWLGKSDAKAPNYSLFVNPETKTWTIIQFGKELSCILGSGEGYTVPNRKPYT